MVSTFTPNIQLEEPARGDQVGFWHTPVNKCDDCRRSHDVRFAATS
ncbi:hypothetical protein V1283_003782 [Bradyrhizobium sp. AZCC 2262]